MKILAILLPITIVINLFSFWIAQKGKTIEKKGYIYLIILIFINCMSSIVLVCGYKNDHIVFLIKRSMILSILGAAAYTDFKDMIIPNQLILTSIVYRILLIPYEVATNLGVFKIMILSELIASVALLVVSFLCRAVMHGSLGFGDMKLMAVMGLLLGLDGIIGAMLTSMFITFFAAIYLMISKRKSKTDVIPFAPFLAIGTCISVFITGY